MINKKILSAILFFAALSLPFGVGAIGQVVSPIVHKDVLRGQAVADTLTLINSESQSVIFDLNAEGDIKTWVKFFKKDEPNNPIAKIEIPKASHLDAAVQFTVPGDIKNGTYTGSINLVSAAVTGSGVGQNAAVRQMVSRPVSITVSDKEIVKVEAYVLPASYSIAKGEPLKVVVKYDNQGNIAVKPEMQLTIFRDNTQLFNAIFPYPEGEEAVKPLSMKTMPAIEWATAGNPDGTYNAHAKILLNGQTIKESDFTFTIGALPGIIAANLFNSFKGNWELLWLGIAVLILAAALLFKTVRERRTRIL